MDSVAAAAVVISSTGVITNLSGASDRFGLTPEAIGGPWADAFPGWDMPRLPDLSGESFPCRIEASAPNGEAVSIELFRIPGSGEGALLAVLDGNAVPTLSDRQQQLCALGEISAAVAHEINNALTVLQGWLDLIHGELDNDDHRRTLKLLLGETQRIGRLTSNLLQVARGSAETRTPLNVADLVGEVVSLVDYEMKNANIEIERCLSSDLPLVSGSSGLLKQALLNLLVNARQAMPRGGKVVVGADRASDGRVTLTVEDTGRGMSADVRGRIFSPFFTTKENGTGLGLPVTRKIVEEHDGSLDLESEENVGTRFTLRLPALKQ